MRLFGLWESIPEAAIGFQAHCSWSPSACCCAISRGSLSRLWAAQLKTNSQSTFSNPYNFTCRSEPVCFSQPKPFSTSQLGVDGRARPWGSGAYSRRTPTHHQLCLKQRFFSKDRCLYDFPCNIFPFRNVELGF